MFTTSFLSWDNLCNDSFFITVIIDNYANISDFNFFGHLWLKQYYSLI